MAEFVTISGQVVRFQTFAEEATEYSGEEAKSFLNTPVSSRILPRRRWVGNTIPYTPAEIAVVRTLTGNGFVSLGCGGPAFDGASPLCRVQIDGGNYVRDLTAADGFRKEYTVRFREV
jgi:hypothetical protein